MSPSPIFHRSELLVGRAGMEQLERTRVIVFGVGGVGSWCAEALIRSGIGHLALVDSDGICVTNVNRQVQATTASVGNVKVDELAARLALLNPGATIIRHHAVYGEATQNDFAIESYDYVVDAIDALSSKLWLIIQSLTLGRTLYSCMGASSRLDPTRVRADSIWKSRGCPLALRVRKRLRKHKMKCDFTVVYSEEQRVQLGQSGSCGTGQCLCPAYLRRSDGTREEAHEWCSKKAFINGSMVQVTATFGMVLASLVINDALKKANALPPELGHRQAVEPHDTDEASDSSP